MVFVSVISVGDMSFRTLIRGNMHIYVTEKSGYFPLVVVYEKDLA